MCRAVPCVVWQKRFKERRRLACNFRASSKENSNRKSEIANPKLPEDFWALKDVSFEVKQGEGHHRAQWQQQD
jgi:ABC-type polysaccharide/polyol phosphate transport system ATPase subunit